MKVEHIIVHHAGAEERERCGPGEEAGK